MDFLDNWFPLKPYVKHRQHLIWLSIDQQNALFAQAYPNGQSLLIAHFGDGKTCNGENIKYSNIYHANNYGGLCQEDQQAQQEQQAQEARELSTLLLYFFAILNSKK